MDQRESPIRKDIEETHATMADKIDRIEDRVHETVEGTKETIDTVVESVHKVQETMEEVKSTVDNILEALKQTMDETVERVKYTADLVEQVNRNPWIMFGSAVLMGYILANASRQGIFGSGYTHEQGSKQRRSNSERAH